MEYLIDTDVGDGNAFFNHYLCRISLFIGIGSIDTELLLKVVCDALFIYDEGNEIWMK